METPRASSRRRTLRRILLKKKCVSRSGTGCFVSLEGGWKPLTLLRAINPKLMEIHNDTGNWLAAIIMTWFSQPSKHCRSHLARRKTNMSSRLRYQRVRRSHKLARGQFLMGQNQFSWKCDCGKTLTSERSFSMVLFLNYDYKFNSFRTENGYLHNCRVPLSLNLNIRYIFMLASPNNWSKGCLTLIFTQARVYKVPNHTLNIRISPQSEPKIESTAVGVAWNKGSVKEERNLL